MGLCVVFVRDPGYPETGVYATGVPCDYIQGCSLVVLGICVRRWVMVFWNILCWDGTLSLVVCIFVLPIGLCAGCIVVFLWVR